MAGWALKEQDGDDQVPTSQGCLMLLMSAHAINRHVGNQPYPEHTQDGPPRQPPPCRMWPCKSNGASEPRGIEPHAVMAPTVFKVKKKHDTNLRHTKKSHHSPATCLKVKLITLVKHLASRGAGWEKQELGGEKRTHTHARAFRSRLR